MLASGPWDHGVELDVCAEKLQHRAGSAHNLKGSRGVLPIFPRGIERFLTLFWTGVFPIDQGSATSGLWTDSGPWLVKNQAAWQELSGRQ